MLFLQWKDTKRGRELEAFRMNLCFHYNASKLLPKEISRIVGMLLCYYTQIIMLYLNLLLEAAVATQD